MAEKEEGNLAQFYQDYLEYRDSYTDLKVADGIEFIRRDISSILKANGNYPLEKPSNYSGLIKRFQSLVEFEKKYPFVREDLSAKALEFGEIKKYLEKRE